MTGVQCFLVSIAAHHTRNTILDFFCLFVLCINHKFSCLRSSMCVKAGWPSNISWFPEIQAQFSAPTWILQEGRMAEFAFSLCLGPYSLERVNLKFGTGDSPMRRWRAWYFPGQAQEPALRAGQKGAEQQGHIWAASSNTGIWTGLDCREVFNVLNQFLSEIPNLFDHPPSSGVHKKIVLDKGGHVSRQRLQQLHSMLKILLLMLSKLS